MTDFDHSYKLLFSHPEMVEDLLTGFVREDWVAKLDFSTLEKLNASYVSDDLRERHDDIVWRVRFSGEWLYVYLLLEFQSTVDPFMAVRIMGYVALLYQDLIRADNLTRSRKLPPVLPIVLYNGDSRWNAVKDVAELIEQVPGGLSKYCPKLEYLLIDEGTYADTALESLRNLTASLFRLENSTSPENIRKVVKDLFQWLKEPAQSQLRRAFTIYLGRVYFSDRPELMDAFTSVQREEEVDAMMATRLEEWKSTLRAKYLEEGIERGIEEGIERGIEKGIEEGIEKGTEKERMAIANRMLTEGIEEDMIIRVCGLSKEQIMALKMD